MKKTCKVYHRYENDQRIIKNLKHIWNNNTVPLSQGKEFPSRELLVPL